MNGKRLVTVKLTHFYVFWYFFYNASQKPMSISVDLYCKTVRSACSASRN